MTRLTFLDTAVVLQNIVATPAATVMNYSLSVSSVIKPFVVVLEVRRFRRHRRSFRLRFLRRPPLLVQRPLRRHRCSRHCSNYSSSP